ncbi:MAG: hypothetical protein DRI57_07495 [Deltaproteobacteria bacterium]|nr:MAG: hypothetical protein DRI57_07495 [Deltaproteobacteria bacterium]
MSEEKITSPNKEALSRLTRAVKWSPGKFSLILARCDYAGLRAQIIEQLHEVCPVQIQEITIPPWERSLHRAISGEITDNMPDAVMILGLESSADPDAILKGANHVRGKFAKDFPFPMILWVTDPVMTKLIRSVTDFYSWAGTSLRFVPSDAELSDALQQNADDMFNEILGKREIGLSEENRFLADLSDPQEFEIFLKDLEALSPPASRPSPHLQFLRGRNARNKGDTESAMKDYKACLSFWKEKNDPEREAVLLYLIGQCCGKDDPEGAKTCFQDCIQAAGECQELAAKCLCELCGVFKEQEDWEEMEKTAEEALKVNQSCDNRQAECLQCHLFLAEAVLHRDALEKAEISVQHVLNALYLWENEDDRPVLGQASDILERVSQKKDETLWHSGINCIEHIKKHGIVFRQA